MVQGQEQALRHNSLPLQDFPGAAVQQFQHMTVDEPFPDQSFDLAKRQQQQQQVLARPCCAAPAPSMLGLSLQAQTPVTAGFSDLVVAAVALYLGLSCRGEWLVTVGISHAQSLAHS